MKHPVDLRRGSLSALALLVLTIAAAESQAQAASSRLESNTETTPARRVSLGVGPFRGAHAQQIRGWVLESLEGSRDALAITDAEGFKWMTENSDFAEMASALAVESLLVGTVEGRRVVIQLRGQDGTLIQEILIEGKRGPQLQKDLNERLPSAVKEALGAKAPAAPVFDEDGSEVIVLEEEPSDGDSSMSEESEGGVRPWLVASAGLSLINRRLTFNDTLPNLVDPGYAVADHKLGLAPGFGIHLQGYPALLLGSHGIATRFSLLMSYEQALSVATTYDGGQTDVAIDLTNKTNQWSLGSRFRLVSDRPEAGISLSYGKHHFTIEGDEARPVVPDVAYSYLRFGADAELGFGRFFGGATLGIRLVFDSGDLENPDHWFRNVSGKALDLGLSGGYRLTGPLDLVASLNFLRYGFDFNPIDREDATRVAGGASDRYLVFFAGVRYSLSAESEPESPAASDSE